MGFAEANQGTAAEAVDEQGDGVTCKDEGAAPIFAEGFLVIEDSESDSTESASSESGESSASEDMEPPVKRRNAAPTAGVPKHGSWVAHRKSGLLHCCWSDPSGGNDSRRTTACGRTVTNNFVEMDSSTDGNQICVMCQRRQ